MFGPYWNEIQVDMAGGGGVMYTLGAGGTGGGGGAVERCGGHFHLET